ncbi:MAG: hypothetical protein ACFE94_02405 [Candidatus Hodarchaeota archaeon]
MVQIKMGFLLDPYNFKRIKQKFRNFEDSEEIENIKVDSLLKFNEKKMGILRIQNYENFYLCDCLIQTKKKESGDYNYYLNKAYNPDRNEIINFKAILKYFQIFISKSNGLIFFSNTNLPNQVICKNFLSFLIHGLRLTDYGKPKLFEFPQNKLNKLKNILVANGYKEHRVRFSDATKKMDVFGDLHDDLEVEEWCDIKPDYKFLAYEVPDIGIEYFGFPIKTTKYFYIFHSFDRKSKHQQIFNFLIKMKDHLDEALDKKIEKFLYPVIYKRIDSY